MTRAPITRAPTTRAQPVPANTERAEAAAPPDDPGLGLDLGLGRRRPAESDFFVRPSEPVEHPLDAGITRPMEYNDAPDRRRARPAMADGSAWFDADPSPLPRPAAAASSEPADGLRSASTSSSAPGRSAPPQSAPAPASTAQAQARASAAETTPVRVERRRGAPVNPADLAGSDPTLMQRAPSGRQRIFRIFLAARAAVGVAVALGQLLIGAMAGSGAHPLLTVVLIYALSAVLVWAYSPEVAPRAMSSGWGLPRRLWVATIGVDVAAFAGLLALSPSGGPNYGALLVMPVLMAGVFMPRTSALAVAAGITLLLLVASALGSAAGVDLPASLAQAGLAATGLFVVALLASELSARLEREERSARGSLERARQEAQLNRLVIDEMRDGVMVVDRGGWVRRANPAARALVAAAGAGPVPPFQLRHVAAWADLVDMIDAAFRHGQPAEQALDATLSFEVGHRRVLRVRPRFTRQRSGHDSEDFCVLFLEDVKEVQARSRQEKLAAMGRVSAGIAHEIRNPLSAIAQANALLAEDVSDASQRRLSQMVADNVERLKRIVDDVLEAAPAAAPDCEPLDATAAVGQACADWARTAKVRTGHDGVLQLDLPDAPLGVHFDPDHLRRVMVNLLENAHRHGTGEPGSLRVRLYENGPADAALLVVNDGEAIAPEVERHLFEPFFSTRSRGSGLGLYICRELCERYGARIDYRQRAGTEGPRNEFHLVMRRRELPSRPSLPEGLIA